MFYRRALPSSAEYDLLDATGASSRPSETRLLFSSELITNLETDSMTTIAIYQLASMRQPGSTRGVAAWRAPMGAAGSANEVDGSLDQRTKPFMRDSRPTNPSGAATATRGHA